MIVTIDGPAGSGKSTLAKALSAQIGFAYLDTGAMYRCVTLACLEQAVNLSDDAAVADIAQSVSIQFKPTETLNRVFMNNQEVTEAIREPRIDNSVSKVAANPAVRAAMTGQQRKLAEQGNVVAEGRDMGTVVFPDAQVKVFLVADAHARALRRAVQRQGGDLAQGDAKKISKDDEQQVLADLKRRDELDSTREVAPLRAAADAHEIDTSSLTVEQEIKLICELIDAARTKHIDQCKGATAQINAVTSCRGAAQLKPKTSKFQSKESGPLHLFTSRFEDYLDHPVADYPWLTRALVKLCGGIVWVATKLYTPWKIENMDKLLSPTSERGCVVIMNHVSNLDPAIPVLTCLFHGIHLRPIYKSEFNKSRFLRWFFSRLGGIPVERHTADIAALRRAQNALKAGDSILIFPEGTRVKEGEEAVVHAGFALMAQRAGADVIPMALVGAQQLTPRGKHFPKPGRVWARVGDPISFNDMSATKRKQQIQEMEQKGMDAVYRLRNDLRKEHPGKL